MNYYGDVHRFIGKASFDDTTTFSKNIVVKSAVSAVTTVNINAEDDTSNAHLWFYGATGSRGVIYSSKSGNVQIRPDGNDNGGKNGYSFAFGTDGKFTCVTVNQTSDERVKFDKAPVRNALEKICSLTGYTFGIQLSEDGAVQSAGVIAQELEKVLPVAVSSGATGMTPDGKEINDLKTVDYSAMSALYVEAFKELADRINSLETELKNIRSN